MTIDNQIHMRKGEIVGVPYVAICREKRDKTDGVVEDETHANTFVQLEKKFN
jgi:hypothetical protein